MADFHQNGIVTTLHNLTRRPVEELDAELMQFSSSRPMSLIMPSLYTELETRAMPIIVEELKQAIYLSQIVIGLDAASEDQYVRALDFFSQLPQGNGPALDLPDSSITLLMPPALLR